MTTFDDLVERAAGLVRPGGRAVLGITGAPGAGKSTLVERLVAALPAGQVQVLPMDGFHLADVELARLGLSGRKGSPPSFDAYGYVQALRRVVAGDEPVVYVPGFERTLEQPIAASIGIAARTRLVITEGNYLLLDEDPWSQVAGLLAEVWYVEPDEATRRTRLLARHVRFGKPEAVARKWIETNDDPNTHLVDASRAHADLVIGEL